MPLASSSSGPLSRHAMAYVLAGGRGTRLFELTDNRAKPAVYFGGKFRIIDFALSNALNSGIRRIAVATQYRAQSLIQHLQRGWNFFRTERNETFDILPASQRVSEEKWYLGTADAVHQNMDIVLDYDTRFIVVLAGDHVYKMDYEPMLQQHVEQGADVTVGCLEVPCETAGDFGVMTVDPGGRIIDFLEKPQAAPPMPGQPNTALASMGIYVFDTRFLADVLRRDAADAGSSHDFGRDVIPRLVKEAKAVAHPFSSSAIRSSPNAQPYWRDVGTIDSYFASNIDLTEVLPDLDLYDRAWPIWTYGEMTAPAKFVHDFEGRRGTAISSLVAGDCVVSGSTVWRSLLFSGVRVNSYASIEHGVVLPGVAIGRRARLSNIIIDRGVTIPEGLVVGEDPELDARRFRRSEAGVCLITKPMIERLQDRVP